MTDMQAVAAVIRNAKNRHARGSMAPAKNLTAEQQRTVMDIAAQDRVAAQTIAELQDDFGNLWPERRTEFEALCKL